jgi:hypothetical protein
MRVTPCGMLFDLIPETVAPIMQAMSQSIGWENGARVPISGADPFFDDENDPDDADDPHALVMVRRLVGFMLADTHPALGIECMALITGIGYQGASMSEIARRHHVTRAAVSKRCVELCESFGIPPVRAMRPERNRERCRKARLYSLCGQ